jgi:hypothetical protein
MLTREKSSRDSVDLFTGTGSSPVPAYTAELATTLRRSFVGRRQVVIEWGAMRRDEIWAPGTRRRIMYAPEVDLAVGPFATLPGYVTVYDRMAGLIGSLSNAATLGRVGVVVAWDRVRMNDLLRTREYLEEMGAARKNALSVRNVLIVGRHQAMRVATNFANVLLTPPPCRPATPGFSRSPRAPRRSRTGTA